MKKLTFLFAILFLSLSAYAQIMNGSVCGIKFGTSREQAKAILEERFGKYEVNDYEGDLMIVDGRVGGINYKFLEFYFAWVDGVPLFNGARFSKPFELNKQKDALEFREYVKEVYDEKYFISEFTTEEGFKSYEFGTPDTLCGNIKVFKGTSKDGKRRIFVDVNYWGPYSAADDI